MFTGIVTDVGKLISVSGDKDKRFDIQCSYDLSGVDIGASIACGGVCLTVVEKSGDRFAVDVSGETLEVTSLSNWTAGQEINLERSLKLGDELGGHIVTGHVDCLGEVTKFEPTGDSITLEVSIPKAHRHLVAKKGSITVDGASLTVNEVEDFDNATGISINLIPHTQAVTSFRSMKLGDAVNIEFDILARYVSRLKSVMPS